MIALTPVQVPAGTITIPAFGFWEETNSGLYRPASGYVGVVIAGAEVGRFGASGLGIGTPAPAAPLDLLPGKMAWQYSGGGFRHWLDTVHQGGAAAGNKIRFWTNTGGSAGTSSAPNTGNQLSATIEGANGGSLILGSAAGTVPLSFPGAVGGKISLYDTGAGSFGWGIQSNLLQAYLNSTGDRFGFGYGTSGSFTELFSMLGTGRLGIGITTPAAMLDVVGGSASASGGGVTGLAGKLLLPTYGGNTSGTDTNRGLYVTGNGGTAGSGGAVVNHAIYVDSTAPSLFASTGFGIGNVAYVWPSANAAGALENDGAGTLSWVDPAAHLKTSFMFMGG